jgi:UDP-sugar pyrophosphorylase
MDMFLRVGRTMVINVEYNQLDPLLRATGHPDGDANSETGYSPYPGNINQVKVLLKHYRFVNFLMICFIGS